MAAANQQWVSTSTSEHLRRQPIRDTKPELQLRRSLHALGARFRLHRMIAKSCTPDIVLPRRRIAIFVDGDFWHGCPTHFSFNDFTGPNSELWREKIQRNQERDARATRIAEDAGWVVFRIWECEILVDPHLAASRVLAR